MTLPSIDLLRTALRDRAALESFSLGDWDLLIRQGRSADLLGRIAAMVGDEKQLATIPVQPRLHIASASNLAKRQLVEVRWEVEEIRDTLDAIGVPLVLLKGAAYAIRGAVASRGRLVSDVDILVHRDVLGQVESALMRRGWVSAAKSAYDQRYYRTWMHEIPPMTHFKRGTVIDVHHAILPLTARFHPSTEKLLAAARSVEGHAGIKTLAAVDMILHSATHLLHEGELDQGMRGLVDIDNLVNEFCSQGRTWEALVPRAVELQLSRPLFYALRYASMMLGTHVPDAIWRALAAAPGARPSRLVLPVMDALFLRALRPTHASTSDRWTPAARWLLFVRGHWLRMPPWLLLLHLARKSITPKESTRTKAA